MKQVFRTLCAVGAMLYAGDVSAMDVANKGSVAQGNDFRNVQKFDSFSQVPNKFQEEFFQEFHVNDGADTINGVQIIVNGVPIIADYIGEKAAPGKGVTCRPRIRGEEIYGISVHYMGSKNKCSEAKANCFDRGIGWHFNILRDGTITQFVPLSYKTFFAGSHSENQASSWNGYANLNDHHIGIMMFNDGWSETEDGKIVWPEYTKEQISSAKKLNDILCKEYKISPFNVIASSDGSMGRYPGPGPIFPFEKVFPFHPTEKVFSLDKFKEFTEQDWMDLAKIAGFNNPGENGAEYKCSFKQLVKTLYLHYVSKEARRNYVEHGVFTEAGQSDFQKMLLCLIASHYNFEDSNDLHDEEFIRKVDSFMSERGAHAKPLDSLIKDWNNLKIAN